MSVVADHDCFLGAKDEDLELKGNVLYWNTTGAPLEFLSDESLECLDQYESIIAETEQARKKYKKSSLDKKLLQSKTETQNTRNKRNFDIAKAPSEMRMRNETNYNTINALPDRNMRNDMKLNCVKSPFEGITKNRTNFNTEKASPLMRNETNYDTIKTLPKNNMRNGTNFNGRKAPLEMTSSQNKVQHSDQEKVTNVKVDDKGRALENDDNIILFLEMVREKPCLWDYKLPLNERTNYITRQVWEEIGKTFPGWMVEFMRVKFNNLKRTYFRKNTTPPSGSAAVQRKEWPYRQYMHFLKDVPDPTETLSNIPEESSTSVNADAHVDETQKFGFERPQNSKSGRSKKADPLEQAFAEVMANRQSPLQHWCLWLGSEIESFPSPLVRLDIQNHITEYMTKKRREMLL